MKRFIWLLSIVLFVSASSSLFAQDSLKSGNKLVHKKVQKGQQGHMPFIDANGDGYNDNAPDDDGDGIPNGLDPDFVKGNGNKGFRDMNGDGIDDRMQPDMHNKGKGKGKMNGHGKQMNTPDKSMRGKGMDAHGMGGTGKGRKGKH